MKIGNSELIRPFHLAEKHFLEVLVSRFSLQRTHKGIVLETEFSESAPTIWKREAKDVVLRKMGNNFKRKAEKYQALLDAFLYGEQEDVFSFDDPGFVFRFASGGTLPIITIGNDEYYCLFYRNIFPVGWNIANGGCDTKDELLNPTVTIERELREELIIVNPKRGKRYVFEEEADRSFDNPEFAVSRKIWQERFSQLNVPNFSKLIIPLKWLEGPDSLSVKIGDLSKVTTSGYFLNINAEDFGIEVDKIAKLNLDEDDILCDGEIIQGRLVNRPVGLFRTDTIRPGMLESEREFIPDRFFYNGKSYEGKSFKSVVSADFIPDVTSADPDAKKKWSKNKEKFTLCPVTKRIIKKFIALSVSRQVVMRKDFDIFITFGSEDIEFARRVYEYLQATNKKIFFSEENFIANYSRAIDEALISADCLIAVGTNPRHLAKPWPEYEYRSFHHYILYGKKPKTAQLLSLISGFQPTDLPPPLCFYQTVICDAQNPELGLKKIAAYVS